MLQVHPYHLLNIVFDTLYLPSKVTRTASRIDRSAFIQDLTYPDGETVQINEVFTKTWELQNIGNVPWENRYLGCMDEHIVVHSVQGEKLNVTPALIPSAYKVAVPYTAPGDFVRISIEFTAPHIPATVVSYWKSYFEDGRVCFPDSVGLAVKVRVCATVVGAELSR